MKGCLNRILITVLDKIIAIFMIILLFLPSLLISIIIKMDSKGPVIFKHKRVGRNGKVIYIYKFRTMVVNAEELKSNFTIEQKQEYEENYRLRDDPRITKIGRILRNLCLDEIPQFINILIGNLSLVGPRPITSEELQRYKEKQRKVFISINPGITGYWQVNRKEDTTYKQRIEMELFYIKNRTIILNIKIIIQTIKLICNKLIN